MLWTPATLNNLINGKVIFTPPYFRIKTLLGNDPSAADPVFCVMPDATTIIKITTASVLTMLPGVTFGGQASSAAIRLWLYLFADGRLGVRCNMAANKILGPPPDRMTTANFAAPGAAGVTYGSSSGQMLYRPIAYVDFDSAPVSGGDWYGSPSRITMVGPNTPMPGARLQESGQAQQSQITCNTGGWTQTTIYNYIQPSCVQHAVRVSCNSDGHLSVPAQTEYCVAQVFRNDATALAQVNYSYTWTATASSSFIIYAGGFIDYPYTIANTLYRLYVHLSVNGGNTLYIPHGGGWMQTTELMT